MIPPHDLPYVLSSAQARAVDQELVRFTGLPTLLLMENAGRGIAEIILRRLRESRPRNGSSAQVGIVCGPGNNGGDGFVVARHLSAAFAATTDSHTPPSAFVHVLTVPSPDALVGDAAVMFRALSRLPAVHVLDRSTAAGADDWNEAMASFDIVVDALFGTGLRSAVGGVPALAIAAMNLARQRGALLLAVDVPSGLDTDTGRRLGIAVEPDITATIGTHKLGLMLDASVHVGAIEVVSLGMPLAPWSPSVEGPFCRLLTDRWACAELPHRSPDAYKGSSGHLVVVAGSAGKTGAAFLVARAAMRTGAGLVTVATTAAGQAALDAKVVEVMTASYGPGEDADESTANIIAALLQRPHVRALAIGPGIPVGPRMRALVRDLATSVGLPMVIDADGLNLLGQDAATILARSAGPRILTPHPGEMAGLANIPTHAVQSDRLAVARQFAAKSGAIVVLKGARTLVVTPDGNANVSPVDEPALATAGSGDVLTGVIAALLVQGLTPLAAAQVGVLMHGRAGSLAARARGRNGVTAGDLPDAVAEVQRSWSESSQTVVSSRS